MTRTIPLTQGAVALVDDEDYERLAAHKWYLNSPGYAARRTKVSEGSLRRVYYMHRCVMGLEAAASDTFIDHINGDGLDNRKVNLRRCTLQQNLLNRGASKVGTSGYKGVRKQSKGPNWGALIRTKEGRLFLGAFGSAEEAARAYDRAALEHHGEFARLNFPSSEPVSYTTSTKGR